MQIQTPSRAYADSRLDLYPKVVDPSQCQEQATSLESCRLYQSSETKICFDFSKTMFALSPPSNA